MTPDANFLVSRDRFEAEVARGGPAWRLVYLESVGDLGPGGLGEVVAHLRRIALAADGLADAVETLAFQAKEVAP